jgi:hypothetical protein
MGPQTVYEKLSYEEAQWYIRRLKEVWKVTCTNLEKA